MPRPINTGLGDFKPKSMNDMPTQNVQKTTPPKPEFIISFSNEDSFSQKDIKTGVSYQNLENEMSRAIGAKIDNGNGFVDAEALFKAIQEAAAKDGDINNLSKEETQELMKKLGLDGIKVEEFNQFIRDIIGASKSIQSTVSKDTVSVTQNGETNTYRLNDGFNLSNKKQTADGNTLYKTYREDGSYSIKLNDGILVKNYSADGKIINGNVNDGVYKLSFDAKYDEKGNYTLTYSNGRVENYNKDGKIVSCTYDGKDVPIVHYDDGSYTLKFNDGEQDTYTQDGKLKSIMSPEGKSYQVRSSSKGAAYLSGELHENPFFRESMMYQDGKLTSEETMVDGEYRCYRYNYDEKGNLTSYGYGLQGQAFNAYEYKKGADGEFVWTGGTFYKQDGGKYSVTHNKNGGYTMNFETGMSRTFNAKGREISGVNENHEHYVVEYDKSGGYTVRFDDGLSIKYDESGNEISRTKKPQTPKRKPVSQKQPSRIVLKQIPRFNPKDEPAEFKAPPFPG